MISDWFASLMRPAATLLSPGGSRGLLSILIYHRVNATPDPMLPGDMTAERFRWQMQLLSKHFVPMRLLDAVGALRAGTLPARAVAVTFDDGYANNCTVALPILRETGVPATFFVATAFLDGGRMWNDTLIETARHLPAGDHDLSDYGLGHIEIDDNDATSRSKLASRLIEHCRYLDFEERHETIERFAAPVAERLSNDLMMTSDQLRDMHAAGMEIGGHTHNHPILARLDAHEARREIAEGRERLEQIVGDKIESFAYPNGRPGSDYNAQHVEMVKRMGFRVAVSTHKGVSSADTDGYQMPRFTPWDDHPIRFMGRLLWNCRSPGNVKADSSEPAFGASC